MTKQGGLGRRQGAGAGAGAGAGGQEPRQGTSSSEGEGSLIWAALSLCHVRRNFGRSEAAGPVPGVGNLADMALDRAAGYNATGSDRTFPFCLSVCPSARHKVQNLPDLTY